MSVRTVLPRVIVAGAFAAGLSQCKRTDADALARAAGAAAGSVRESLPSGAALAGPLAPLRPARLLPPEERVRARFDTDAALGGLGLDVRPGAAPGQVRLRGVAPDAAQRARAESLAASTAGVSAVVNEIGVAE